MKYLWIGAAVTVVVTLIGVFAVLYRPDPAPGEPPAPGNASADRLDEEEVLLVIATLAPATLAPALGNALANSPDPALGDATISLEFDVEDYEGLTNEGHGEIIVDVWIGDSHGKLCVGLDCGGLPSSLDYKLPEGTLDYRIEGTENEDDYLEIEGRENEVTNLATPVGGSGTIEVRDGRNFLLEMEGSSAVVIVPGPDKPAVPYDFSGFRPPVNNYPTINVMKAGGTVPIRFSLGGDRGLDIFAPDFPQSREVLCGGKISRDTGSANLDQPTIEIGEDPIEELVSPTDELVGAVEELVGESTGGLRYDAGQYTYNWKTDEAWSGSCRALFLSFKGGNEQTDKQLNFRFQ